VNRLRNQAILRPCRCIHAPADEAAEQDIPGDGTRKDVFDFDRSRFIALFLQLQDVITLPSQFHLAGCGVFGGVSCHGAVGPGWL